MFSKLKIKRCYRTKKDDVDKDFFIPILKNASVYNRGTGFFSVDGLAMLAKGIIPYVKRGGIIRIITSVMLDLKNIEILDDAIQKGRDNVIDKINEDIEKALCKSEQELDLDLITNLIAANRLQIRIAYLPDGGIYHEKIGYFEDINGNKIWFLGSNNETYNGIKKNVESLSVMKSWQGDLEEIDEQKDYFMSLWNGNENGIEVFSFPETSKNKLFSKYRKSESIEDAILKIEEKYADYSINKKYLYKYQSEAIEEFVANKYCHFFEMATGTGKTFTAVKAVERLSKDMGDKSLYVVVAVPQIDLQVQWKKEFEEIGINPYCFGGKATSSNWELDFDKSMIDYFSGEKLVVSICIYDTYFSKVYNEIESKRRINKILIVDEAHELSPNQISKLSNSYRFRLGLSATPQRHNPSETKAIINYFTKSSIETFKYSIDQAIENGFLSKYLYFPLCVHLEDNESEFKKYQYYTARLAFYLNEEERDQKKIQEVCNNRSLIVKKATNKLNKIEELVKDVNYDFTNAVVYCGQGKDLETEEMIIDNVSKILAEKGNYKVSHFTSKTTDRALVLKEFENGYYDTLIAIKCFDQGVDVPKLDKIYIMASDTLERQTIQRRGRVLRKCKETGKQIAYIFDMITLPPVGIYNEIGTAALVSKELNRAREYGRLAENYEDVMKVIYDLSEIYGITEESDDEKEVDNE